MVLQYQYGGKPHTIVVNWTDSNGRSVVYREIARRLTAAHGETFEDYVPLASELDGAADNLYKLIELFSDEYHAIPYNPKNRTRFIQVFKELCDLLAENVDAASSETENVLTLLFAQILDKLQEVVGIYLVETTYQHKHNARRKLYEDWLDTMDESKMHYDSEDILLRITDISTLLDCLTETQRRRLVMHLFLKYSTQEIADKEGTRKQVVHKSITTALKKIKERLQG